MSAPTSPPIPISIPDIEIHRHYQLISTTPEYLRKTSVLAFLRPSQVGPLFPSRNKTYDGSGLKRSEAKKRRRGVKDEQLGLVEKDADEDEDEDEDGLNLSWAKALDRPLQSGSSLPLEHPSRGTTIHTPSSSSSTSSTSSSNKPLPSAKSSTPTSKWSTPGLMISNPTELRRNLIALGSSSTINKSPITTSTTTTSTSTKSPSTAKAPTRPTKPDLNSLKPSSSRKRKRSTSTPPSDRDQEENLTPLPSTSLSDSIRPGDEDENDDGDDDEEIQPTQEEMEDMDLAEDGLLGLSDGSDDDGDENREGGDEGGRVSKRSILDQGAEDQADSVQVKISRVSMQGNSPRSKRTSSRPSSSSSSKRRSKRPTSPVLVTAVPLPPAQEGSLSSPFITQPSPDKALPPPPSGSGSASASSLAPRPSTPRGRNQTTMKNPRVPTWATMSPTPTSTPTSNPTPILSQGDRPTTPAAAAARSSRSSRNAGLNGHEAGMDVDELETPVRTRTAGVRSRGGLSRGHQVNRTGDLDLDLDVDGGSGSPTTTTTPKKIGAGRAVRAKEVGVGKSPIRSGLNQVEGGKSRSGLRRELGL